jgi:Na+/melibiose symporter-like transporter
MRAIYFLIPLVVFCAALLCLIAAFHFSAILKIYFVMYVMNMWVP